MQKQVSYRYYKVELQLTRICDQNKEHKRLLNNLASRMGLKSQDGTENRRGMNSARETIPCKIKDNGKCGDGTPAAASSATCSGDADGAKDGGCAFCKKYSTHSPNAWKAHCTKDCKKYNGDGTTKLFDFSNSRSGASSNGNKKRSAFANLKKQAKSANKKVKKIKRQLKYARGHGKSKREYYSSSSSSSSDSDGE